MQQNPISGFVNPMASIVSSNLLRSNMGLMTPEQLADSTYFSPASNSICSAITPENRSLYRYSSQESLQCRARRLTSTGVSHSQCTVSSTSLFETVRVRHASSEPENDCKSLGSYSNPDDLDMDVMNFGLESTSSACAIP